jgi:activator of 2-hydroxyglutaryl-CoA dehydratase
MYAGIDIGSCTTKAVVIDDNNNITGSHVLRSGVDYHQAATEALNKALNGMSSGGIPVISTGYGRRSIDFALDAKTEIACHARGAYF